MPVSLVSGENQILMFKMAPGTVHPLEEKGTVSSVFSHGRRWRGEKGELFPSSSFNKST